VHHTGPNPSVSTTSAPAPVHFVAPGALPGLRRIILGLTLFIALLVWVAFSVGLIPQGTHLVTKLRVVGVMTWLYVLVQVLDTKFWRSRFAQRRRAASRVPEAVEGWLMGQMVAWFGIVYYALTDDPRWFVAGLLSLLLSFVVFPIRDPR
jgi:hypothetical protein